MGRNPSRVANIFLTSEARKKFTQVKSRYPSMKNDILFEGKKNENKYDGLRQK
jgi:hypothetical protein